jgi:hypothetical protein
LIVALGNKHRAAVATALRFIVAVSVGWVLMYVYALQFTWSPELGSLPPDGDGAKIVFAMLFGWVIPAGVSVAGWWLQRRVVRGNVRAAS